MKIHKKLEDEVDDSWRRKGILHIKDKKYAPKVCTACNGTGTISLKRETVQCTICLGTGEVE